jgi:RNA polymerase sigma-70 factor (ECF subfamily)
MCSRDEELMLAVGQGDLDAFEELVIRHQASAWHLAFRFLEDRAHAEDIAQEAFLRVLESAGRWRETATFRTYLYQIIARLCRDFVQKKSPESSDRLGNAADQQPLPDEGLVHNEQRRLVREAIAALPPNQRTAVILRYYHDLGYEEIAAVLATTVKGAERLLARGRAALRRSLGGSLEEF